MAKTQTRMLALSLSGFLWRLVIGVLVPSDQTDASEVWCRWNASCLLEVGFSIGDDVVIHWLKQEEVKVHSYYYRADRLESQDERFKGRTSLFKENIDKGNASLLLRDVAVADEGTYKCYVGTLTRIQTSFVNLHVEAPVTSVRIRQEDERQLLCRSGGIFPEPKLRWSTEPALPNELLNTSSVRQETRTELYEVSGWLRLVGGAPPDVEYVCDVSGLNGGRRAAWSQRVLNISEAETDMACANVTHQRSLVWTFNRTDVIASRRAGQKLQVTDDWRKHVRGVSQAGVLQLRQLTANQSGTYTCTLNGSTQTRVRHVVLRVTGTEDVPPKVAGVALGVLGALGSVAAVAGIYLFTRYKGKGWCCKRDHVFEAAPGDEVL